MTRRALVAGLAGQRGYTAIEMIITMAVTATLSTAIFSSFLVLDRIESAWQDRDQSRAVGVLAEQSLVRDVQAYRVKTTGSTLVLEGVDTAPSSSPVTVTYFIDQQVLKRTVQQNGLPLSVATTVAHGVQGFAAQCSNGVLTVSLKLSSISTINTSGPAPPVDVSPALTLSPRNGCV